MSDVNNKDKTRLNIDVNIYISSVLDSLLEINPNPYMLFVVDVVVSGFILVNRVFSGSKGRK